MLIDFRNTNTVWASVLVETLKQLGLKTAIVCPGSRSTPLAIAFAQHPDIEAIPVLDERSAAFFGLGIAKKLGLPVALICTSGTAGANFYPAVIEARESRVPLLILTADRPPELRECHSGQTIDQVKLYGTYPNWQIELALPSLALQSLSYLRQTLVHAWERSRFPTPGVVHLNVPFCDPLAPIPDRAAQALESAFPGDFFSTLRPSSSPSSQASCPQFSAQKGIIIAGSAQPHDPEKYCQAIAQLAQTLNFPVLADGLSPVRNYAHLNPNLISTYDLILRHPQPQLTPEVVLQIGELPTSKELRAWLSTTQAPRWIFDPSHHNLDPLHGKTIHLRVSVEQLIFPHSRLGSDRSFYLQQWLMAETKIRSILDKIMADLAEPFEGKVAWLLPQILPEKTPIFIANSMPVRDVEYFWKPNSSEIQPFFNRGANGIDGTLSTALGIAQHQPSVMLTGDLALLHDTNGFLLRNKFSGHLTIILINNNGGGIFEMLPISQFNPPFEDFFATPQDINFSQLCATYNIEYEIIKEWGQLQQRLNQLPTSGIRLLEVQTNRQKDALWRKENFQLIVESFNN